MATVFSGHYDGQVIVPDEPLSLPIGERVQLRIERLPDPARPTGAAQESLYEALKRLQLVGCVDGGPADLSTNPAHLEGFGSRES